MITNNYNVLLLSPIESEINSYFNENNINYFQTSDVLSLKNIQNLNIDIVISYRYRHIIKKQHIDFFNGNIINLHSSLLPHNRGAHPNFWSFYENTPKGISIHYIDECIDSGDLIFQKEYELGSEMTFKESYNFLDKNIKKYLIKNFTKILNKDVVPIKQTGQGTFHNAKDILPFTSKFPNLWDMKISTFLKEVK